MSDRIGFITVYGDRRMYPREVHARIGEMLSGSVRQSEWHYSKETHQVLSRMNGLIKAGEGTIRRYVRGAMATAKDHSDKLNLDIQTFQSSLTHFYTNIGNLSKKDRSFNSQANVTLTLFKKDNVIHSLHEEISNDVVLYNDKTANVTYIIYADGSIDIFSPGKDFNREAWMHALAVAENPYEVSSSTFYTPDEFGNVNFAIRINPANGNIGFFKQENLE